jgi:hypothetical protein
MKKLLAVGAAVLALSALTPAPADAWARDYSQQCGGLGNQPIDCASRLMGRPVWHSGDIRRHTAGTNPSAGMRADCRWAVRNIYIGDSVPLSIATNACNTLRVGTRWSWSWQRFV